MICALDDTLKAHVDERLEITVAGSGGVPDRAGIPYSLDKRRLGVRAEVLVESVLRYRLSGPRDHYDLVGVPVHIRSSRLSRTGIVGFQPREVEGLRDGDQIVVVFAVDGDPDLLDLAGWLFGSDVTRRGSLYSFNHHPPAWWVRREDLRNPIGQMPAYRGVGFRLRP